VIREVREETGYDVITTEVAFIAERRTQRWDSSTLEICFYAEIIAPITRAPVNDKAVWEAQWLALDHPNVRRHLPHVSLFESSRRGRYINQTPHLKNDAAV
jgi:8-oxo-dGTP pyrophosphatase MutT (NUDIX family)